MLYDKVNNNNGTMYNGSCISLDGGDESVNCGNASDLDVTTGSFTIIGWINNNDIGNYDVIVQKGNAGHGSSPGYRLRWEGVTDLNKLMFICTQSSSYAEDNVLTADALAQDTWYQVAITRNAGLLSIYIDGALNNSKSTAITGTLTNSEHFVLGYDKYNDSAYFNGQMADWKFFNTALSAANIKELYDDSRVIIPTKNDASGGFVSQSNLKLSLSLSEGAGVVCYDGSGNGNHGTFTNADSSGDWLTGQTGPPQLVEGYNRPMLFPGATTEYVAVGNSSEFCFGTSSFSFGAWIKSSYTGDFQNIFDATNFASSPNKGWQLDTKTTTGMRLWLTTGSSNSSLDTSTQVTDGQWHHVGFTWYGGSPNLATIYVDGSADTSSGAMGSIDQDGGAYAASIGFQVEGTNYPFNGLINEVVLYDALLSSSEMAALAATGPNGGPLPPDPMSGASNLSAASNVKGYWRNDGDVTWTDRSGEGNNGTVAGSPDILLFKQGINGQKNVNTGRDNQGFPLKFKNVGAVGFNGSNTKVAFSDVDLNLSTGATVSFWCNHSDNTNGAVVGSDDNGYHSYIQPHENGTIYFESSDDSNTATGAMSFTDGFHNYVLVVKDYTATFYEDGRNITTDSSLSTANVSFNYIGTTGAKWFKGSVANLQMYNRALSQTEIKQNFAAQASRFT